MRRGWVVFGGTVFTFQTAGGAAGGASFGPPYMGGTCTNCANFFWGENCKLISYKG